MDKINIVIVMAIKKYLTTFMANKMLLYILSLLLAFSVP